MRTGARDSDPTRRRPSGPAAGTARALALLALLWAAGARPSAAGPAAASDPVLSAALPAAQRAELAFLEHLGWRLVRDPAIGRPETRAGTPCYRKDLEAAHAAGDLRIALPAAMTPAQVAEFGASLPALADAIETRCAYKQRYALAAREATRKLADVAARGLYTFPQLIVVNSPWFRCTLPKPEWNKVGVESFCTSAPSKGIEAVYQRGGVAECYTGQWIAIYATQYELYGPAWFDEVFRKEELRLGRPVETTQTAIGRHVDESQPTPWRSLLIPRWREREDAGLVLAELGPKAFSGLTGILQNEDEDPGANQNLMIVSISPRAVEELRARGGLRRILEVTREANEERKASRKGLSASEREGHRRRYEELMADPVTSELIVYVQPLGIVPFARVADKEMDEDGKPVKLRIYTNGLDEFLYQRYRDAWKARWLREQGLPPPAPAAAPAPATAPAGVPGAGAVPAR